MTPAPAPQAELAAHVPRLHRASHLDALESEADYVVLRNDRESAEASVARLLEPLRERGALGEIRGR